MQAGFAFDIGGSMAFRIPTFAVVLAFAIAPAATSQQTTKDGVRQENAINRPDRPYCPARSSDPRDAGPHVAKVFGKRDRRLV
jgi:hypothetical protein